MPLSYQKRDRTGRTVELDERGLVLMPSAYLWPHVAAIVEEPWLPTIAYPAQGIAELWRAPTAPPDALAGLLGRTRALILANLDLPLSTPAASASAAARRNSRTVVSSISTVSSSRSKPRTLEGWRRLSSSALDFASGDTRLVPCDIVDAPGGGGQTPRRSGADRRCYHRHA